MYKSILMLRAFEEELLEGCVLLYQSGPVGAWYKIAGFFCWLYVVAKVVKVYFDSGHILVSDSLAYIFFSGVILYTIGKAWARDDSVKKLD